MPRGYINQCVVEGALRSGEFFLIPYGDTMSPMLRQVVTINAGQSGSQKAEWKISTNTHSDHLTSTLERLMVSVLEPIRVAAAVRQKADPASSNNNQNKQAQQKETYWVELVCEYKDPEVSSVEDMGSLPYKATFSDGSTKEGYLSGGYARLNNIPGGDVEVVFGYPDAETKLKEVRREIQVQLNGMLSDAAERAKLLDQELAKNSIAMQSVILTGAFLDGMFGPIEKFSEFCADVVSEAQVRFDQWDAFEGIDDYEDLKDAVIEKVGKPKKDICRMLQKLMMYV